MMAFEWPAIGCVDAGLPRLGELVGFKETF